MKVLFRTADPTTPGVLMNDRLSQCKHLQNTEEQYDSFIFGSSRSKAFKTDNWKKYLSKSAKPYHMGVNDESIFGISKKIEFLKTKQFDINNILIQLDPRILSLTKNSEAHVFREHYLLTGESVASYYQRFFTAFLNVNFLVNYCKYKSNGTIQNTENHFLWNPGFTYNINSGDIFYSRLDNEINSDSLSYYKKINLISYPRTPITNKRQIIGDCKELVNRINRNLKKLGVKVKIIISPNFDQVKINPEDLSLLKSLFGTENVIDLSGANSFTNELGNYYESKHFKPYIANRILKKIYLN